MKAKTGTRERNSAFILIAANPIASLEEIEAAYARFDWKKTEEMEVYFLVESLRRNKYAPISILCDAAVSKALPEIQRKRLFEHENFDEESMAALYSKHLRIVGESLPQNANLPESLFDKMSQSRDEEIRRWVSKNNNAPAYVLDSLADDKSTDVRAGVAANKSASLETLFSLFEMNEPDVVAEIASNESITADLTSKVYEFGAEDKKIRGYLIDGHTSIHRYPTLSALARNQVLPNSFQKLLLNHESDDVRSSLGRNSNLAEKFLRQLSEDASCLVRAEAAMHIKAAPQMLANLSEDSYSVTRERVARNPKTPASLLDELADDKSVDVRLSVGCSVNALPSTLEKLVLMTNKDVREAALQNPNLSPASLESATAVHKIPKRLVVNAMLNTGASTGSLKEAMRRASLDVRCVVAGHHKTDPHILDELVDDKSLEVILKVLWNPACPKTAMKKVSAMTVRS